MDAIGFDAKKKINNRAMQAVSCVIPATRAGENLSESFHPRKFPIHIPAPANTITIETYLGIIPETFTSRGFI